jgi:hypothetical protein
MEKPIKWNEYELTEFLGVLAQKDDDELYLSFNIEKDGGMRLLVTFFHYDLMFTWMSSGMELMSQC